MECTTHTVIGIIIAIYSILEGLYVVNVLHGSDTLYSEK